MSFQGRTTVSLSTPGGIPAPSGTGSGAAARARHMGDADERRVVLAVVVALEAGDFTRRP